MAKTGVKYVDLWTKWSQDNPPDSMIDRQIYAQIRLKGFSVYKKIHLRDYDLYVCSNGMIFRFTNDMAYDRTTYETTPNIGVYFYGHSDNLHPRTVETVYQDMINENKSGMIVRALRVEENIVRDEQASNAVQVKQSADLTEKLAAYSEKLVGIRMEHTIALDKQRSAYEVKLAEANDKIAALNAKLQRIVGLLD